MLFVAAPVRDAEKVRATLLEAGVLVTTVSVQKNATHIFFPVTEAPVGMKAVEREAQHRVTPKTLKESLVGVLSPEELDTLIGSYDILGSLAILEIPETLAEKEERIAAAVLEAHPHVTTVLKKAGIHGGEFRTQSYVCIAGIDTRETLVKESGCDLLVDVERVYFSIRLSTERLRLASLVGPDENVLVLFSGAAPYVVVLAKKSIASRVVGVEKNPIGHEYATHNLGRNKIPPSRAAVYCGDAADLGFLHERNEAPFDRIIMMLPSGAKEFISSALTVANPERCSLHVYGFAAETELHFLEREILEKLTALGWHGYLERSVKAGHHKPFVYRWCIDVTIHKKKGAQ